MFVILSNSHCSLQVNTHILRSSIEQCIIYRPSIRAKIIYSVQCITLDLPQLFMILTSCNYMYVLLLRENISYISSFVINIYSQYIQLTSCFAGSNKLFNK